MAARAELRQAVRHGFKTGRHRLRRSSRPAVRMKKAGGEEEGGNFFGETPTSQSFYSSKRGRQGFFAGSRSLAPDPFSALQNFPVTAL
jgi:hypothetical protein